MVSFNHTGIECSGTFRDLLSSPYTWERSHGANFKWDGQHWFELEKIELALKDFYAATLLTEGKRTSLADWTLDCLLREINETKDHYHDIHVEDDNNFTWKYLQSCADAAWSKCEEYYNNQQLNWQKRFPEDTDIHQRIMQLKYSIHIESGHGSSKNGFSKATKKNRSGFITHNRWWSSSGRQNIRVGTLLRYHY